jgi:ubiquinone/menaquinone biosynthesis C-methylase UbiE
MPTEDEVAKHYARGNLAEAILAGLAAAGKDPDRLRPDDLAPIDEFHVRGREATAELGDALGLAAGMQVLDVGSGLGGPSRFFADRYGCRVTGIDLTAEYCEVARLLAERVGLGAKVDYQQGSALAMPFAAGAFDAAFTQHVAMNIEDKATLYAEVARVLRSGGAFGIYDLLQGEGGGVVFPVPWARTPATSFLAAPGEMRRLLEAAGFEVRSWRETAAEGRAWFEERVRRASAEGPPPLGFHLLLGPDFAEMARNMVRNLTEGRIVPTEIVCRRR